jgi:hypothetical protein
VYERSGWLETARDQQAALAKETARIAGLQFDDAIKRQKLEVQSVQLSKTRNDLAAANRAATARMFNAQRSDAPGEKGTAATERSSDNGAEAERVFSIDLATVEKLDQLTLESDEVNDAYAACRASITGQK